MSGVLMGGPLWVIFAASASWSLRVCVVVGWNCTKHHVFRRLQSYFRAEEFTTELEGAAREESASFNAEGITVEGDTWT